MHALSLNEINEVSGGEGEAVAAVVAAGMMAPLGPVAAGIGAMIAGSYYA